MKRILAYTVLILGLVAFAIPIIGAEMLQNSRAKWDVTLQRSEAFYALQERGLAPDLTDLLARGRKPDGWVATWVVEVSPDPLAYMSDDIKILAADPPGLVGKTVAEARQQLASEGTTVTGSGARTKGKDGKHYEVWMVGTGITEFPTNKQATWAALIVGLAAWLTLAAWVWLDARDRGSNAAPGWLLLALLTGPVALAVWFISRYTQEGFAPLKRTCPGCGGETPRSSAFCVRCGHALRPACPDCRRPVELDWVHCGTCGTELK